MSRMRRVRRATARLLLIIVGLMTAEAVLQLACLLSPDVAAGLSGLKPRYVGDPVLDVRGDSSLEEYDERGFRNAVRPARATVVAIGDSQTEGSGVEREHAWPQRLAAITGLDVYQMAFGSYGPGHYLALTSQALSLDPRTVLVAFYAGNDLPNMYDWVYSAGRSPELRAEDPGTRATIADAETRLGALARTWERTRAAKKDVTAPSLLGRLSGNVVERSKLVLLGKQIAWRLREPTAWRERDRTEGDWNEIRQRAGETEGGLLLAFDAGTLRTVLTPPARRAALDTSDPRIAEGLRMSIAALNEIGRECAGKTRLIVVDLPTKEMVYADVARERLGALPPDYEALVASETAVHAEIARALADAGIERIDALPALRGVVRSGRNPYPMDWDGHPNVLGHDAIARAVAALVREDGRIGARATTASPRR